MATKVVRAASGDPFMDGLIKNRCVFCYLNQLHAA